MKLMFVNNLEGTEVLAKNLITDDGKTLLKSGTTITSDYISKLIANGVFFVYVEDSMLDDIADDKVLGKLKQDALVNMPLIFNDLISNDEKKLQESLSIIEDLVDYISETKNINTNLFEVKSYDNYTYIHCVDTSIMSSFLGASMGLTHKELRELGTGAVLHDIGKTKIANSLINKVEPLSGEEFAEIKLHVIYGGDILRSTGRFSPTILNTVLHHHEKVDGTGYPFRLTEPQISRFAKIVSISDVYTAVSANRSYRKRFSPNEAYELILSGSGTAFSSPMVDTFRKVFAVYPLGCRIRLSNGTEGYVVKQNQFFPDRPIIRVVYEGNPNNKVPFYEIDLLKTTNITIDSVVI